MDLDPNRPTQAKDKRRQNIDEGRGASIAGRVKIGNYEKTVDYCDFGRLKYDLLDQT